MIDSLEHIWGNRTPLTRAERWRVRVDRKLVKGLAEADAARWLQSACLL